MKAPCIDISSLVDGTPDAACIAQLGDACLRPGVFQITGHGVDDDLSRAFLERMQAFFALPTATRHRVLRTPENPLGFYDRELTKNQPDWKQVFDCACERVGGGGFDPEDGARPLDRNQWPDDPQGFRDTVLAWIAECERLSFALLGGILASLEQPPHLLDPDFAGNHTSFLRLNYYPPCDVPAREDTPWLPDEGRLGVHHHTDAGAFTILFQDDVDSLQMHCDDAWHLVEKQPGALIVNLADMLQVWTNDRYRSPLHRVLARSGRARYSAPYFFNPSYRSDCRPLPALCGDEAPRYRAVNWGEFRRRRTDGDYADQGEEVQVAQYRT